MVNVSNSDNTVDVDINPRTNYELADIVITVKDENGTVIGTFVRPAAINTEVTVNTGGGAVGLTIDQVDQNWEDVDVNWEEEIYT
jgi:YbbR domain-containing protein